MAMNPNIILAGQPINALGLLGEGNRMAQESYGFGRQREMDAMLKQSGAGIMAGDQNALNALAGYSPEAALGVQTSRLGMDNTRLGMQATQQRMDMLGREEQRQIAEHAASMSKAEREAAAAQIEDAVRAGLMARTPQEFDALMMQTGQTDMVGMFDKRQALAARFMSMAEVFKQAFPEPQNTADRYRVVGGSLFDLNAEGGPAAVGQGAMQEEIILGPDGKPIVVRGGPGTNAKFTEGQSKDNVYATRAEGALRVLDPVADALAGLGDKVLDVDPTGLARGSLQSDKYQIAKQAGDEFLQAILRKDTGAAITEGEQVLYGRTYLPQPGDNAAVIEQKKTSRTRALKALQSGMSQAQLDAIARADAAVIASINSGQGGDTAAPAKRLKFNPATGELE